MSASDHLNRQLFRMHHFTIDDDNPAGSHMIEASTGNNKKLGVLTWHENKIDNVSVSPGWQRRGMATQMFQRARSISPELNHSGNRTDAGNAWAKSVSGSLPPRMQDDR